MSKDVKETVKKADEKIHEAVDTGKEKVKEVASHVQDAADKGKEKVKDFADQAKDHLKETTDHAHDKFQEFSGIAEDEFSRLYGEEGKLEAITNFVRDRPILSLGAAVVSGVVFIKILKCLFGHKK